MLGIYPAISKQETVSINTWKEEKPLADFNFLRQQSSKGKDKANLCLADYVCPEGGKKDYMGFFTVTTGIGIEKLIKKYNQDHNDYKVIMVKALADRLAEAFAEVMHTKVRKELWGYETNEDLLNDDLIAEKYIGIRPAPGYPACPDHSEKKVLFDLLDVEENIGVSLTESCAMYPTASVSGFYFAHPEAKYFGVGKIGKDQVEAYAEAKNITLEEAEK